MNINYQIIIVDPDAKSMEVVYSVEGGLPIHVGVPLPYVSQNLEQVIRKYIPIDFLPNEEPSTPTTAFLDNLPQMPSDTGVLLVQDTTVLDSEFLIPVVGTSGSLEV